MLFKKKYLVVFMTKENEIYNVLHIKKINPLTKSVKYDDRGYIIDTTNPTYTKTLKLFFLIDVNKELECQLFFNNTTNTKKSKITPQDIDLVVGLSIVKQLTTNLSDTAFKMNLMYIIFGALFGGLLGWILGGSF